MILVQGHNRNSGSNPTGGSADLASVDIVTVPVAAVDPLGVIGLGVTEQVVPGGWPLGQAQLNITGWSKPPTGVRVNGYVAGWPAVTVEDAVELESLKSVPGHETVAVFEPP